jgi:hypothetical protein
MMSQSPLAAKISLPRPDWFSAATAIRLVEERLR